MTDKTREDFEAWAQREYRNATAYCQRDYEMGLEGYQAATQQSAARIAALEAEVGAIAELNHAQWLALENVRHLAARNRKEEWAQHLLRFVDQAGTNKAQIMRRQVDAAIEAERGEG